MARQAIALLLTILVFGVALPWAKGYAFLDPVIVICYACLGVMFVAPIAADAFAPTAQVRSRRTMLARMALLLAYGWGISALMLLSGILTVNLTLWQGSWITPSPRLLGSALLLCAAACGAVIALTALLSGAFGGKRAKTILRMSFLILLLAMAFGCPRLPEDLQFRIGTFFTTAGMIRLALQLAAILAAVCAALTAWWMARLRTTPTNVSPSV